ncbi:MAG TPA: crossover junction endodeoxyribonuclease RuvC, partial [Stellaceae bacterium]|nr:crossover junction endodeoxyribonuclease RuvC [Stellaceae bacterium]
VVGVGHADKTQVQMMVKRLLPGAADGADACDALAVAICHAHHAATRSVWSPSPQPAPRRGEGGLAETPKNTLSPSGRGRGARRAWEGEEAQRKPTATETARARRSARDATDAEKKLWAKLRNAQLEKAKFRRQEPILGFTADFVCHEKRLIVEIDGGQHDWREAQDARRTRTLEQAGFRVVRFWNNDVLQNIDGVLEQLRESLAGAAP